MNRWIAIAWLLLSISGALAAEVQVLLKIHALPLECENPVEIFAHREGQKDYLEFRQISHGRRDKLVTSEWRTDLPIGSYDISAHAELTMIAKLIFASKRVVTKKPGEVAKIEFDLFYNEVRLVPLLDNRRLKDTRPGAFLMVLDQRASESGLGQYQEVPLSQDSEGLYARFFFLVSGEYKCSLIQVTTTAERPIARAHKWHKKVKIDATKGATDVRFEESSVSYE